MILDYETLKLIWWLLVGVLRKRGGQIQSTRGDRETAFGRMGVFAGLDQNAGAMVELKPRDTVIVASDGLMDNLHVAEIIDCVRKGPMQEAVRRAVSLANQRMIKAREGEPSKPDDLSLILFRKPARPVV